MIIGVDWDLTVADPATCCVRIGPTGADLPGHVDSYAGPTAAGYPFDAFGVWGAMRRVNLSDAGVVNAAWGDGCFSDTNTLVMGQVMVEIPKHLYWVDTTLADHLRYYVADIADAGSIIRNAANDADITLSATTHLHPAFKRNTVVKAYIYVGAYEGYINSLDRYALESCAGRTITLTAAPATYRTAARARVAGAADKWETLDYLTLCDLQLLYLVEYANPNCQTTLGYGNCGDGTAILETGITQGVGNVSYGLPFSSYIYHAPVSYRGIENLWGNCGTHIDGLITNNYVVYVADHGFNDTTPPSGTYVTTGLTLPSAISLTYGKTPTVATATACPYSFIPAAAATDAPVDGTKWCCDDFATATGYCNLVQSGWWHITWGLNGIFSHQLHWPLGAGDSTVGARLVYIG